MNWKNINTFTKKSYMQPNINVCMFELWRKELNILQWEDTVDLAKINRVRAFDRKLLSLPPHKDHAILFRSKRDLYLTYCSYDNYDTIVNEILNWNTAYDFSIEFIHNGWYQNTTLIVIKLL